MLRKYPLTTLFIIATVCVDVVLVVTSVGQEPENSGWRFYLWNYLFPSQISTLALWGVFGKTHRLTKAAVVTLAGAAIIVAHGFVYESRLLNETTTFNLFHMAIVIVGALCLKLCGVGSRSESKSSFQFSLVEMFGWSMIVALWAFALRAALAKFPVDAYAYIWMVAATLPPLLIAPVLFGNLSTTIRLVGVTGSYLLAMLIYGTAVYYAQEPAHQWFNPMVHWAFGLVVAQISYISAWWAVIRMDEAMQERQAISEASREKLKVFEPESR
jgi:hypothetical protein